MKLRSTPRTGLTWAPILWLLGASACTEATQTQATDGGSDGAAPSATPPGTGTGTGSTPPGATADDGSSEQGPSDDGPDPADSNATDPGATDPGMTDGLPPAASNGGGADDSDDTGPTDSDPGTSNTTQDDSVSNDQGDAGGPSDVNPQPELDASAQTDAPFETDDPTQDASAATPTDSTPPSSGNCDAVPSSYDDAVLCDGPVGYWALSNSGADETDLSGNGHDGQYVGGTPETSTLPNGDAAADFDGESQYLSIESAAVFSIPTTGMLTWEAWIQPAVVNFANNSNDYVDWMGKCAAYGPTCEWEARMYNADSERCNRLSAYAFNPGAGLGSGAYFERECGSIQARDWVHVVGQYTLLWQPEACSDAAQYPGSIEIWVNGTKWNQAEHGQTGCMSQYQIAPEANDSPINVGTMAGDAWFEGAIGKLAIYDYLLDADQIAAHYRAMTGSDPVEP